ncbi:GNAT family N-acetyltransferase [Chryseobacterium turcicum]|uniref:GNAT family N-acetyltransferase n=1 Tax=Chryseobacterium turcicum TaxID=2898076 RepID=A0A9Q3V1L4_9FLAO|nr:GNAT family N-acetyltransferase [Chryseobacterium turcicum]MCD1116078.1 GNAT family N-acetyltransferase [Chryseobacterium turcicum]
MQILRTTSENPEFQNLVKKLDVYLAFMDGEDHAFYDQFNKIDMLKNCVVVFENDEAVSCGAIKALDEDSMEVKRMFKLPDYRGKGLAVSVLKELEVWAKELEYKKTVLETGKLQVEAVALYKKCGYEMIPNYGQYIGIENSICFDKIL